MGVFFIMEKKNKQQRIEELIAQLFVELQNEPYYHVKTLIFHIEKWASGNAVVVSNEPQTQLSNLIAFSDSDANN